MFFNIKNIFKKELSTSGKLYMSCNHINSRLYFFDKKMSYCSIGNRSNNRICPTLYDYDGGEIDIDKLLKRRINDKENLKNGNMIEACQGCSYLELDKWDEKVEKNQIEYIQFSDWGLCNSKCIYCGSWHNTVIKDGQYITKNGQSDTYPIVPIIKKMIKQKVITPNTSFNFAGGEPTLYFQFNEAIKLLLDYGAQHIDLFSNIINYSKEIEAGIKLGVINLVVSIDAGSREIHEKVKGVESYDKVWENFAKYVLSKQPESKNKIISKYVIVPKVNDSNKEIEMWVNKSREIGIVDFILNGDNRIYENGPPEEENLHSLKNLANFFIAQMKKYELNYELDPNIVCLYH